MTVLRRRGIYLLALIGLSALVACGSATNSPATDGAGRPSLSVVTSTNVYGDIVKQLAGNHVKITSIISDPDQDPHSYEANAQNQLELSKAKIIVENGGGYDDFVDTMLKSAHNQAATVLNVVELSGKQQPGQDLNEHVWYDFPTMTTLADKLTTALSAADPSDAATFTANAATFKQKLHDLEGIEARIKSAHAGAGVAITEPVPLYMLQACGLTNRTPAQFSEAIEEGSDVSPTVLQQTLDLFSDKQVKLLAYNEQTSGPETDKVLAAAKSNGIAVVGVTETLPAGQDYLTWMGDNLTAIKAAFK